MGPQGPMPDLINDLVTGGTTAALTAEQGKALKTLVDAKVATSAIVNDLTSGGTTVPLSAEQGKTLKGLVDSNSTSISELQVAVTDERDSKEYSKALSVTADGFLKLELTEIIGG
jgi:hypothetical protein